MARTLDQLARVSVSELSGIGPKEAAALGDAFEIETVLDLLTHYPHRHHDKTRQARIEELGPGDEAWLQVRVLDAKTQRGRNNRSRYTYTVTDGTGRLSLTWFTARHRRLTPGQEVLLFGKVEVFRGTRQMTHPEVDLVGAGDTRMVPVYPQSTKHDIRSSDIERWVSEALDRAGDFAEPLPAEVRERFGFTDRTRAVNGIHRPQGWPEVAAARRRLVFDELARLQLALVLRKRALETSSEGIAHRVRGEPELVAAFHGRLPYQLTDAQRRVIGQIDDDLARPVPMHRLLQGDVGSGKTIVAVSALLVAVQGGHQGAFMAPTEVLAEQHYLGVRDLLDGLELDDGGTTLFGARPLRVELLTNRTTAGDRARLLEGLAGGTVDLLIGTHALLQDDIAFRSLGVVVIDEQHRFGVEQRAALRSKGAGTALPDVLVMTATPIPRTAAMTVYGDLDVSVLDELPPGREPITTTWAKLADGDVEIAGLAAWDLVRDQVAVGRQAYVVCPLVEESEKLQARSAEGTYDELVAGPLAGLRLALLHGRMAANEKQAIMARFRARECDVLVATTVIEVGVDVPNATVMVVLDADRFGIAQLHQLRGRVGRAAGLSSHCVLVAAVTTPESQARLEAMVQTQDGFELAEIDLGLRGEGTIMGERQKGRNDLKLASLRRDLEWVLKAREVAVELVDGDADLARHPLLRGEVELLLGEEEREFLLKS